MHRLVRRTRVARSVAMTRTLARTVTALVVVILALAAPAEAQPEPLPATLIVGDSLCVGAHGNGSLGDAFGGDVETACEVGRPISWGIDQIRARTFVPDVAVVAMGTNPGPNQPGLAGQLDTMRALLVERGATTVVWVTATDSAQRYGTVNSTIAAHAHLHGDTLADWAAAAAPHPEWFAADGLHYRPAGQAAWAATLAAATVDDTRSDDATGTYGDEQLARRISGVIARAVAAIDAHLNGPRLLLGR